MCLLFCFVLFWIFCYVVCEKIKIVDNKKKKTPVARGALLEFALFFFFFFKKKCSFRKVLKRTGEVAARPQLKSCTTQSENQQHWIATSADAP